MSKKIITVLILCLSFSVINSQSGFDNYLAKDSVYRYNTSLKVLDSLLSHSGESFYSDTVFDKSFAKAESITLNQLLFAAVNNNPDLKTISFQIDSKKEESEQKAYLPDPMVEFELDDIMSDFTKVGMINFYVSQMIMFPGKLQLEKESVLRSKTMLESEKIEMAVKMMNMIRMDYYDLFLISKKLQVNAESRLLIKTFLAAAEARYSVGKGMQQEVFKAQIEFSRLQNEEFILNSQKKNLFADLAKQTKIIIDDNAKLQFYDINSDYLLDNTRFNFDDKNTSSLVNFAFSHRSDLLSLKNKVSMNLTDLEMAKISRLPDMTFKLGYKILPYAENNAFTVMLGINIPIAPWTSGKYNHAISKSEINIKTTEQEIDSKKNEIRNEITGIVNSLRSSKETMSYYYTVMIPQTENSLKATQYSYENNMTGFLDLLDSYRMYQDSKIMYWESVTMYLKMIGELEYSTGLNLKK